MNKLNCFCGAVATGTTWVSSPDGSEIYECEPACYLHGDFRNKYPHGFIPGIVTADVEDILEILSEIQP